MTEIEEVFLFTKMSVNIKRKHDDDLVREENLKIEKGQSIKNSICKDKLGCYFNSSEIKESSNGRTYMISYSVKVEEL